MGKEVEVPSTTTYLSEHLVQEDSRSVNAILKPIPN
jgi:hypothetical protein